MTDDNPPAGNTPGQDSQGLPTTPEQHMCARNKVLMGILAGLGGVLIMGLMMAYVPAGSAVIALMVLCAAAGPMIRIQARHSVSGAKPDRETQVFLLGLLVSMALVPFASTMFYHLVVPNNNMTMFGHNFISLLMATVLSTMVGLVSVHAINLVLKMIGHYSVSWMAHVLLGSSVFIAGMIYIPLFATMALAVVALFGEEPMMSNSPGDNRGEVRWVLRGGVGLSLVWSTLLYMNQPSDPFAASVFGNNAIAGMGGPVAAVLMLGAWQSACEGWKLAYTHALKSCKQRTTPAS